MPGPNPGGPGLTPYSTGPAPPAAAPAPWRRHPAAAPSPPFVDVGYQFGDAAETPSTRASHGKMAGHHATSGKGPQLTGAAPTS